MEKIELLLPAGDLFRCKIALIYGADAVYIGGQHFSLRSRASNFTDNDILQAVEFAHSLGKKIYVTINMIFHDEDLDGIEEYLLTLNEIGVDGIIVASVGVIKLAISLNLNYEIHVSTQLSVTNSMDVEYLKDLGVNRVVLARELSIEEIKDIKSKVKMPLEIFVHGAMCTNYSGRCTLSNEMTNRDANRGGCAQSCRWKYRLFHQNTLVSDEECLFSMSSKDLVGIDYVSDLIDSGIESLKIEGRMKSTYYIAVLAKNYRSFIDEYYQDPDQAISKIPHYKTEIQRAENRLASSGFFEKLPDHTDCLYGLNGAGVTHDFLALVLEDTVDGKTLIEVRNAFKQKDILEVLSPNKPIFELTVDSLFDEEENRIVLANQPTKKLYLQTSIELRKFDILRRKKHE